MTFSWLGFRKYVLHILILAGVFLVPLVWSRYLNANYVSAKFFLVYLVSAFSLFVSSRQWVFPQLPKPLFFALSGLIFLHLVSPFLSGKAVHVLYMFKFLSFSFFAYYFYSLQIDLEIFLKKYDFLILVTAAAIFGFAGNDFYTYRIEKSDITSVFLMGSFGNVNMMAEFFILSLPLIHLWGKAQGKVPFLLKNFLFWGWIFFILYCRSRSAWIGLGLWGIWGLTQKKITRKEVVIFVLALICYQVALHAPHVADIAVAVKGESFKQRLNLYQTTLKLIVEHPFGVGVGLYFNEITPYLMGSDFRPVEYVYYDQPHSEILKWAVQFGWLGFVLPLIVFGYLSVFAFRQKNFFLTSSLMVILPQIVFQFPFENPASLMYLAFVFALALALFPAAKRLDVKFVYRIPVFIVALIGMAHAVFFVTAIFFETSHENDVKLIESACELYPVSLNGCFVRDQFLVGSNRNVQGRLALSEDLGKFPYHAGLMRILPSYLKIAGGDDQKACEAVLMYDFVYQNQKFFKPDVVQKCRQFKVPVSYYTPSQFRDDYTKWLEKVFKF